MPAPLAAAVATSCSLPPGWAAVEQRHTRYIIFGETHGTEQAPAFVGRVACALSQRGERILLAIEQSATDDAAFQPIWAGPDRGFADRLRRAPGWKGRSDGMASEAMFALLVRLHGPRRSSPVDVVLFNGSKDDAQRARYALLPNQGPHEAAQAENIRTAADHRPYDHVLVLTGSLHARKDPMTQYGTSFPPMAMQLAPAEHTTSPRFYGGEGTAWNCLLKPGARLPTDGSIPSDAIECGAHAAKASAPLRGPPLVALGTPGGATPEGRFDGYVWLGPITGSAPAVP